MNYSVGRYAHLVQCLAGYKKTGISLIEFTGTALVPSFAADDLGIYILIPKLAHFFHCSLDTAINLFFYGIAIGSFLLGLIAFFLLYKSWLARFVSFFCLSSVLLFSLFKVGDVYLLYSSTAFALVPWILYFLAHNAYFSFCIFNIFAGYYMGVAHYIRAYSSIPVLIFLLFLLIISKIAPARKVLITLSLLFGLTASFYYFSAVYAAYTTYAQKNFPECFVSQNRHVLWHAAYCGLGFLNFGNKDKIEWDDTCAANKAVSINAEATIEKTALYETVLKKEVLRIIKEQPLFFLFTLWAKIGVLLFYFLLFAHLGILAAFLYPNPWYINAAFSGALLFCALFPLLTVPVYTYSLGFIAFAALFGIVSINNALYALRLSRKDST